MKRIVILFLCLLILVSCTENKEQISSFWISGFKVSCDPGAGLTECLLVSGTDDLDNTDWELFYANIDGFTFEEGYLKKVKVDTKKPEGDIAADQSAFVYKLVEESEKKKDTRLLLQGDWQVESIKGQSKSPDSKALSLSFDLKDMKINGFAGCNSYQGSMKLIGLGGIVFGDLLNTLSICENLAIEDNYLGALREVKAFKVAHSKLYLQDKEGQSQLVFTKMDKTKNSIRINDIWSAVRIEGNPINRMVSVPRLEINTSEMKIYGNDGCNEYFGSISELTEKRIAVGNIGSTRKMCPDMEIPQRYNNALSKVEAYLFDKQILVFKDSEGNEVLAFMKAD
jgi:heat shock protein HslJ